MTINKQKFPPCFGRIEKVFPVGEDDLREVPESCMFCCYKKNCIKLAINGEEGLDFRKEIIDRAYSSGALNFFQRWSRRKSLQQIKNNKKT